MKANNSKWIVLMVVAAVIGAILGPTLGQSLSGGAMALIFVVFIVAVVALVIWSLSGNKVGKPASAAETADARTFKPAPGMARIYVVRRGFMGGLAGMKVAIRGVASGQVRMNQFLMADVQPGTYTIDTAMARNGVKPSDSQSEHTVHAGDVLVILSMLQMEAMHARTVQQRLLGAEAEAEITRAKMVRWNEAPVPSAAETPSSVVGRVRP